MSPLKLKFFLSIAIFSVLFSWGATKAQSATPQFAPPLIHVSLAPGKHVPPENSNINPYIFQGSEGFPSGSDLVGKTKDLYWFNAPAALTYPDEYHGLVPLVSLQTCGFTSREVPKNTLTFPSGRKLSLFGKYFEVEIQQTDPYIGGKGCWNYSLDWTYGMERGLYSFDLSSTQGELRHTWAIDYPFCPAVSQLDHTLDHTLLLLMGFEPGEKLLISLYATDRRDPNANWNDVLYAQTVTVNVDKDGAALLDINVQSRAAFSLENPIGYTIQNAKGGLYFGIADGDSNTQIQHKYPCNGHFEGNQATVAADSSFYTTSTEPLKGAGTLKAGTKITILDQHVDSLSGHTMFWYHIQTEDGQQGWINGPKPALALF